MTTKSPRPAAPTSSREHDDLVRSHDLERVAACLYYLNNVQPLQENDYSADREFSDGRSILLRLLELEVRRLAWPAEDEAAEPAKVPS